MLYKNIFLIDDDIDDTEMFIDAVNSLDQNILCRAETNPLKALEYLKSSDELPDLIFLDYNMPVLNGSELLEKIRGEKKLQSIRVIVYSSYSQHAAQQLSIVNGTQSYITKPLTFMDLKEVLKEVLGL